MVLLAIIFVLALALSLPVLVLATRPAVSSKSARQRLVTIKESVRPQLTSANGPELAKVERSDLVARVGVLLERYPIGKGLKLLLLHANSGMSVGGAFLASVGAALTFGLLSFFILHIAVVTAAATIAGLAVHYGVLRFKRGRRLKKFNTALPDAIDLMARSLMAGHSMGSSIELIAEQSTEPLASEFVQVYQQQRLGLHFRDALLQMGNRVPSRDLQFLITAILVQKETGGDLTDILQRASHVIRERVRIEGEVRTHTAQGRLTGWILSLLPVIMLALINMVSPGYSSILFHDPLGQKLLYAGGSLIVLGGLIIRKIVDVQV
jgi:tight adherence protein B